jgi:RHS repeat-associated protein
LTTGEVTTHYYLGDRFVAMKKGTDLRYIRQEHLTGTALVTSDNGTQVGTTKYYPYGDRLKSQGDLGTDKLFTGQRLDDTGLYYYNARYYDPLIGRFISPDTIVPDPMNPQSLNRYSYCLNNPLKYTDPTGHLVLILGGHLRKAWAILQEVAPDLTKALDVSPQLVIVVWDLERGQGSYRKNIIPGFLQRLNMDPALKDYSVEELAMTIAHEAYHADKEFIVDTIQEEVEAFQFQYEVGTRIEELFVDEDVQFHSFVSLLIGMDPTDPADLIMAKTILGELRDQPGETYREAPLRDLGGGFYSWSYNEWGAEVISMKDPKETGNYNPWDWY